MRAAAVVAVLLALGCASGPAPPPAAPAPPESSPPAPEPASQTAPVPELRPQLAPEEAETLLEEARREIGRTGDVLDALEREPLPAEASQRLAVTRELLAQARDALEAGDALGASSLARKAAILADDLSDR